MIVIPQSATHASNGRSDTRISPWIPAALAFVHEIGILDLVERNGTVQTNRSVPNLATVSTSIV